MPNSNKEKQDDNCPIAATAVSVVRRSFPHVDPKMGWVGSTSWRTVAYRMKIPEVGKMVDDVHKRSIIDRNVCEVQR